MFKKVISLRKIVDFILDKKNRSMEGFLAVQLGISVALIFIVCFTFFSFYKIAKEDAVSIGEKAVYEISAKFDNYLLKGNELISISSESVDFMLKNNTSDEMIKKFFDSTSENLKNKDSSFTGLYGYINGKYVDGSGWIPDSSYNPKARDWYINAIRAKGDVVVIPPYVDSKNGTLLISISRMLSDYSSVISIDVNMDEIQEISKNISLNGEWYGFIINKNSLVLAHTMEGKRGRVILKDDSFPKEMQDLVGNIISDDKKSLKNEIYRSFDLKIKGERVVAFSRNVMDDWYVVMVVNSSKLFERVRSDFIVVIIMLSLVLVFILYYSFQIFRGKKNLEKQVLLQTQQIRSQSTKMIEMQISIIDEMATLIEARDASTGNHVRNTKAYCKMMAEFLYEKKIYPDEVDKQFITQISYAAPLHDVGKITIPDSIFKKPGKLDDWEFEIMKNHTRFGGAIVQHLFKKGFDAQTVRMASDVAMYHHERWDGKGYPIGLSGDEIPLSARILAIADCFDALVSERCYKKALPLAEAYKMIQEEAGTHFEPLLVKVFATLRPKVEDYLAKEKSSKTESIFKL